jgi:hypothetical protein
VNDPGWRWKAKDAQANAELNLRYEPGTWGDLIKGAWALRVADATDGLSLTDPFAGAVDYPLVEATAARLDQLPAGPLADALASFRAANRFPSTASLLLAGADVSASVFDVDDARRATWQDQDRVTVLDVATGADALPAKGDLLLVDPYDLFERWEQLVPVALGGSAEQSVLFYLFNKAPRGAAAHRRYLDLRARVAEESGERRVLVGRVPSDGTLPRAFHEILLVAPTHVTSAVEGDLRATTIALSRVLSDAGAFEG